MSNESFPGKGLDSNEHDDQIAEEVVVGGLKKALEGVEKIDSMAEGLKDVLFRKSDNSVVSFDQLSKEEISQFKKQVEAQALFVKALEEHKSKDEAEALYDAWQKAKEECAIEMGTGALASSITGPDDQATKTRERFLNYQESLQAEEGK